MTQEQIRKYGRMFFPHLITLYSDLCAKEVLIAYFASSGFGATSQSQKRRLGKWLLLHSN